MKSNKSIIVAYCIPLAISILMNIFFIYAFSRPNSVAIQYDDYFLETIYKQLVDKEFYSAKFNGEYLELRDKDYNVIDKYQYPETEKTKEIISIRKEIRDDETYIFFIYRGAMDDESGVFRSTAKSINMSEITEIRRIGGGLYYYNTR